MRSIALALLIALPAAAQADTFILKDGVRLEGEVAGEMNGAVLIKTKYGSLTVNRTDIAEQKVSAQQPAAQPEPAAQPAQPVPEAPVSTQAAVQAAPAVSTQAAALAVEISTPAAEPAPRLTFAAVEPSTTSRLLVYYENGVAIATETYSAGALALTEGAIKNGTYTEYYPDGSLKTVKSVLNGRTSGTLRAYYPGGKLQIEAYYLGGAKDGAFKYYAEDGSPLMEAQYSNDKLNGLKKEFGPGGVVASQAYYEDDHLADQPKPAAAKAAAAEPESLVSAKSVQLARGERFSFQLNGKFIGKLNLDKDYNLIDQEGKVPDGTVRVYSSDGKLQKELVFQKNALKTLRIYEEGGPLKAEYGYSEDKAVKK